MRLPVLYFSLVVSVLLPSACQKSTPPADTGFVGEWRMIQVQGSAFIDVGPINQDNLIIMRLLPDSTVQSFRNGSVVFTGVWSLRQQGSPVNPVNILAMNGGNVLLDSPTLYQARLTKVRYRDRLILRMVPDYGYQATYTRN